MNLEIEPEEYEDLDVVLDVVEEALRLITTTTDVGDELRQARPREERRAAIIQRSRLQRGYGPEVIWTLNILADRAIEMMLDDEREPSTERADMRIRFAFKQSSGTTHRGASSPSSNFITVGQPFVGGGLTTRPLGNYIIDDKSLLFNEDDDDDDDTDSRAKSKSDKTYEELPSVDPNEWLKRVESARHILESVRFDQTSKFEDWHEEISRLNEAGKFVAHFLDKSKPALETTARQIDKQLQLIQGREKYLQAQLRDQLEDFLKIWRNYFSELARNKELLAQVDSKTDKFETLDSRLHDVHERIEARKRDLNDSSKLGQLKALIGRLEAENKDYDERIAILLAVYFKLEAAACPPNID